MKKVYLLFPLIVSGIAQACCSCNCSCNPECCTPEQIQKCCPEKNNVSSKNVELTIDRIVKESDVLAEMQNKGEIMIVGAMYDINTGRVNFYN